MGNEVSIPNGGQLQQLAQTAGVSQAAGGGLKTMRVLEKRNLVAVIKSVEEEIALIGEDAIYSWTVNDNSTTPPSRKLIEGLSIDGAMVVARHFGNCSVEANEVVETPTGHLMPATFTDHQTGFSVTRIFKQAKGRKGGGNYGDAGRKDEIDFAIGQSKALRNVIDNGVSPILVKKAIEAAKSDIRKKVEDQIEKRGSVEKVVGDMIEALSAFGIGEPRVLAKFHRATREAIELDDMVLMWNDLKMLRGKKELPDNLYPVVEEPKDAAGEAGEKSQEGDDSDIENLLKMQREATTLPKPAGNKAGEQTVAADPVEKPSKGKGKEKGVSEEKPGGSDPKPVQGKASGEEPGGNTPTPSPKGKESGGAEKADDKSAGGLSGGDREPGDEGDEIGDISDDDVAPVDAEVYSDKDGKLFGGDAPTRYRRPEVESLGDD